MSNITIPDDPSVILPILNSLKKTYFTGKTRQLSFRKAQLKSFLLGLTELKQDFQEALAKDLGYSPFMTEFLSQYLVKSELSHSIKNFEKWTKKINVSTPVLLSPACSSIIPEPYGVALVIGAWNYPFVTSLQPVISAIAAGNCCVLKPSEMAPYSSNVMKKLFDKYLDKDCYQVIEGQINVAIKITTLPFDLIIFTGSPEKGRLVAKAAAENLVPCILELGGKSPTIVDEGVNLQNAALRITQGRFFNCGQTCIAPDYVLVQKNVKEAFTKEIIKTLKVYYYNYFSIFFYIFLYFSIFFYIFLYFSIFFYIFLYFSIFFYIFLYFSIFFYIFLYFSIFFYIFLYFSIFFYIFLYFKIKIKSHFTMKNILKIQITLE